MKFKVIQKAFDIEVSYKLFDTIEEAVNYYYNLDNDTDKYIVPVEEGE